MADNRTSNKRTDVVQCEFCGEYYSVTYKRCPFCDEIRAEQDQANGGSARSAGKSASSAKSGGRRIAPPTGGSGSSSGTSSGGGRSGGNRGGGGSSFNVLRVIGVAIPLVLIVAAIYIIITVLGPMITAGKGEDPNSTPPSQSQSASPAPSQSASVPPSQSPATPSDPNAPPIPSGGPVPSDTPGTSGTTGAGGTTGTAGTAGNVTGITLDKSDFTLTANESWKINATLSPSGASGTITWSVDNPDALRVAQDGTVTNINSSSSRVTVNVTATCGNVSATCIVRCAAGSTPASPEPSGSPSPSPGPSTSPSASPSPSTSPGGGTLSPGPARVANTGTGLRVRSGPGTNYEAVASLVDGDDVQIVRAAENGWYEITFKGTSGQDTPGYVLGEYLTQ